MRYLRLVFLILIITGPLAPSSSVINIRWIREAQPYPGPNITIEQYGTGTNGAGNTTLHWTSFIHNGVPRPGVLVLHVGGWKSGQSGPVSVARDLYFAGFNSFAVEYRLADPGTSMHAPNGDQPLGDHGNHPEQVEDVSQAIIAARTGSTASTAGHMTGEVAAVGGSAGATHAAWFAGAVYNPGDKLDCAVMLSLPSDLHDPSSIAGECQTNFGPNVYNYVNCTPGDPACDGNGGLLDLASPYRRFGPTSAPVAFYATNVDPMPSNQYNLMVAHLTSVGAPFISRLITEPPYNVGSGCTRHAFTFWNPITPSWPDSVNAEAIAFLTAHMTVPPP